MNRRTLIGNEMNKIKQILKNKWVGFTLMSLLYLLWFVLWTGNWWLLLGEVVIFDLYITRFFYRYVGRHNERWCQKSRLYKFIYEWVNAIIFAMVVASLIHIFIFQMYTIPTSSMEKSLLVGDYLYVSKVAYGPKMPNTPLSFPLVHHTMPGSETTKSYSEWIKWPYHRLKGLGKVKRGDAVVFNFPAGDTVLLERQNVTYYDILRMGEEQYGKQEARRRLFNDYTVVARPVDKREHYIKRCIALPGDTLRIANSEIYINGVRQEAPSERQFFHTVVVNQPLSDYALQHLGITEYQYNPTSGIYYMSLTHNAATALRQLKNVVSVERYSEQGTSTAVYPHDGREGWNADNYGPIWIPKRGETILLTPDNLALYGRCIDVYEGNDLQVEADGAVYINGEATDRYTFQMDYYWMMGDNRHNSADSRYWGFVPEDHVVGRAAVVWLSLDPAKKFPANIRWERMFRTVK